VLPEQLVLLYSGSMNEKQGLELLVEAMKILKDRTDLVWIMGGEGPSKPALEMATRHLPQVRHLGLQPNKLLNEWLNMADIHLLPQKAAATDLVLPSKVLGILASGKTLLAATPATSTLGHLAEQAGRRVNPGDKMAFAQAVVELASDANERETKGKQARWIARQYFEMDAVLGQFEKTAVTAITQDEMR